MNPIQQQVHSYLKNLITDKPLYAIIDSAQNKIIIEQLHQQAKETPIQSLYEGKTGQELALVAPYLAQLNTPDNALLKQLIQQGWGNHWAVYFNYPGDLDAARNQLRQCLRVSDTDKQYQTFRFYDPRVFRKIIPTFDMSQLITFYGAIGSYWLEDSSTEIQSEPNSNSLLCYQIRDLQLSVQPVNLNDQPLMPPKPDSTMQQPSPGSAFYNHDNT